MFSRHFRVSAAVVQRYLSYIVEAALTPAGSQLLLRPALEAIGFTVKQGLAHPMQCLPVLVALESGPDQSVVRKAFSLHSNLHNKHSALINTRISESIEAAFTYQSRLTPVEQMRGECKINGCRVGPLARANNPSRHPLQATAMTFTRQNCPAGTH